ncbi:unnamed protein product [Clavelina lepadiformis]|uniref:LAGLIDADG homing endonuclease n=1 Tax=Clavelina lepadiformis TaxID=159417 RepID=A0ABP0F7P3_CLALP
MPYTLDFLNLNVGKPNVLRFLMDFQCGLLIKCGTTEKDKRMVIKRLLEELTATTVHLEKKKFCEEARQHYGATLLEVVSSAITGEFRCVLVHIRARHTAN